MPSAANLGGANMGQPMDDGGLGVRQADDQQEEQLIGGADDYRPRRQHHARPQPMPEALADEGLPDMNSQPAMGMGPQISHPEPVESEEALMAKAIEDSLALNNVQPAAN